MVVSVDDNSIFYTRYPGQVDKAVSKEILHPSEQNDRIRGPKWLEDN